MEQLTGSKLRKEYDKAPQGKVEDGKLLKGKERDFPGGLVVKNLPCYAWDMGWLLVGELTSHTLRSN